MKAGPESVAAFVVEPVVGSSAAGALPPSDYFDHIQAICHKYGVITIADEILCGTGRTGKFFASEHFHFRPDILLLGKGMSGGYAPLSVVMTREDFVKEIFEGTGYLSHAQTYLQAPCMTVAGCAILDEFDKYRLVEHVEHFGKIFQEHLHKELEHPHVGHIDGLGFLAGIEFVADRSNKKPFDRSKRIAERFTEHAFENGLIVWPNVGHVDGVDGDLIMLGPPLNSSRETLDEVVRETKKCILSFNWDSSLT